MRPRDAPGAHIKMQMIDYWRFPSSAALIMFSFAVM